MRTLGIDPGLQRTGYAVLERASSSKPRIIEAGVIRLDPKQSLSFRLRSLFEELNSVITEFTPNRLAVEELFSHYERPRTAILMGHARGAILLAGEQHQLTIAHYPATKVKKFLTGNGRADKAQMQRAIMLELAMSQVPDPPDVADALSIALCDILAPHDLLQRQGA